MFLIFDLTARDFIFLLAAAVIVQKVSDELAVAALERAGVQLVLAMAAITQMLVPRQSASKYRREAGRILLIKNHRLRFHRSIEMRELYANILRVLRPPLARIKHMAHLLLHLLLLFIDPVFYFWIH